VNVIKQSIKAQKLKQWQIANRIGVNNGRLSSIINGKEEPNDKQRVNIMFQLMLSRSFLKTLPER